jgi:hypothetical protein
MPRENRDRLERFEELHGFLHQSMISAKNVARLATPMHQFSQREYYSAAFSDRIDLGPLQAERLKLEAAPEAMFFQDSFPAYRRVLQMVEENVPKDDPLRKLFCDDALNKVKLSDAVWLSQWCANRLS